MLSDKKLSKIKKTLELDLVNEFNTYDDQYLKHAIVAAESNIKAAEEELEANPKYQDLKESLKALAQGMREVKKFQRAKIDYALHLLEEKGKV